MFVRCPSLVAAPLLPPVPRTRGRCAPRRGVQPHASGVLREVLTRQQRSKLDRRAVHSRVCALANVNLTWRAVQLVGPRFLRLPAPGEARRRHLSGAADAAVSGAAAAGRHDPGARRLAHQPPARRRALRATRVVSALCSRALTQRARGVQTVVGTGLNAEEVRCGAGGAPAALSGAAAALSARLPRPRTAVSQPAAVALLRARLERAARRLGAG